MENAKNPIRAILASLAGLACFYIVHTAIVAMVSVLFYLLSKIPFLQNIVEFALFADTSRIDWISSGFAAFAGYLTAKSICKKIAAEKEASDLSCILLGSYLLVLNIIYTLLCLLFSVPVWTGLAFIAFGILLIIKRSNDIAA